MAIPVEMPKMSDTMEEGVLVAWLVKEGEDVAAGDIIAQVETDKATMDLEAYDDGVLLKQVIGEGAAVPIGGLIAVLGRAGEDISDILAGHEQGSAASGEQGAGEAGKTESPEAAGPEAAPEASDTGNGRLRSSPLARRLAGEHGLDLKRIAGSGPDGRIVKRDVEAAIERDVRSPARPPVYRTPSEFLQMPSAVAEAGDAPESAFEAEGITPMRKTIARRLSQSKFTAPHFYLTVDVDVARAAAARARVNRQAEAGGGVRISFNDLVTKACAVALRRHPYVNASWLEEEGTIRLHRSVHVAVAVAIDEGLVTPVIRHADRKGLMQIATETRRLAQMARERTLRPEDWEGSTFTTSNLGMYGIEEFTAIINPPNSGILAVGAVRDEAVVQDGAVVPGKRMKLTLSCDHRLVDGAVGSAFLRTVQQCLEEPLLLSM